ncbi:MAG TPA: glycogen debranching N-terminal domain-containing protein [Calidithermus sp.]|nr:glycogen debranching N-terminal domain-containing protein [Calidithermus sp.]
MDAVTSMEPWGPASDFHIQAAPEAAALPKLVLKHGEAFLVADRRGDFPVHFEGELGFYRAGTRYLRWLELRLDGTRPLLLGAEVGTDNDQILVALTNADLPGGLPAPEPLVPRNTIHLERRLVLYDPHLLQTVRVMNFHDGPCTLTLEILFAADFRDVFEVRGTQRPARGQLLGAMRDGGRVHLGYRGLDGVRRTTTLAFHPPPLLIVAGRALYRLTVEPGGGLEIEVAVTAASEDGPAAGPPPRLADALGRLRGAEARLPARAPRVSSDHEPLNVLVQRSWLDLNMLLTDTPQGRIPYAGVPWYVAPFGRDSLITAHQLLPWDPEVAAATLRFLAHWQGRRDDPFRDEEPGKILHEYRRGEMANLREIPFIPYYGSVDATPLFVVLLGDYVRWTGDLALARALAPAVRAAVDWIRERIRRDGWLTYSRRSPLGLGNQGWKDSHDAVMHADGRLARPPIALVEVQGYAYAAYRAAAALSALLGDEAAAARLAADADALQAAFNREFWMDGEEFYALAVDGDGRRCEVVTSNPGHCLWTGIVDERRAPSVAKRLLAEDMFSGWGIRTLSTRERRYNPMSYHNGSVWPHDNALAVAGFRRYGLLDPAVTVAGALVEASRWFEHARVPELFCGFPRVPDHGPIAYPVACAPQAWAAGAPLLLLAALLGFEPDAPQNRLTLQSPVLPPWLRFVEIHDLQVGRARLDLAISRGRENASVELIARRGDLEVIVRR